jgi:putative membrane protein
MKTVVPLIRAEFARLTASKLGIASLVALMTVPLFYGGLYLWGNHDPYANLKNIPAALVVSDTGTKVDGAETNYGRKAATSLLKQNDFDWVEVSATVAAAGVEKGTYDFALQFPADFSTKLASAAGDSPKAAALRLTTDDTNSYLSTTIAKQAAEDVRVEVAKEVGAKASITLLDDVSSIRSGLVKAQKGAATLADGAATASSGASSLASGTTTLASGASTLSSGLATIDSQTSALPANAAQLASGAARVAAGTQQIADDTAVVRVQLATLLAGDPNAAAILAKYDTLTSGLTTLNSGAQQVSAGAAQLDASAPSLASGIHTAATGAAGLSAGAAQAAGGASQLASGTAQVADGASSLDSALNTAITKIPATTSTDRRATAGLIANPLSVKQDAITEAADYGAGLAPFFLSLSSWIGIYALFLLVRPLSRRALTAVRRPIRTMLAGWLTPALLGVVQMIALFALVTLALHLPVAQPVALVAFMAFVALTFAATVLALNVLLGSVGQFLALIFMVVQLVVAGGTFPWQTLPGPLRALHQILPMSHAVDGMRQFMYGGVGGNLWSSVLPLVIWLVLSLLVAALGARRQGKFRTLRELRPSAIGG